MGPQSFLDITNMLSGCSALVEHFWWYMFCKTAWILKCVCETNDAFRSYWITSASV